MQKLRGLQLDGKTPRRGATPATATAAQGGAGAGDDHRDSPGGVRQRLEGSFEVAASRGAPPGQIRPAARQGASPSERAPARRVSVSAGASAEAFHALQLAVDGKRFGTAAASLGAAAAGSQTRHEARRPASSPLDQASSGAQPQRQPLDLQAQSKSGNDHPGAPALASVAARHAAPAARASSAPDQAGHGLGAPGESPTKAVLERHRRQPSEGGRASFGSRGQSISPRKRMHQVLSEWRL